MELSLKSLFGVAVRDSPLRRPFAARVGVARGLGAEPMADEFTGSQLASFRLVNEYVAAFAEAARAAKRAGVRTVNFMSCVCV